MFKKHRFKRGLVLLFSILMLFCLFMAGCGGGAKVKPLSETPEGIYPNTSFEIKVGGKVSLEELQQRITLEPTVPFSLSTNDNGTFTLIPQKAFALGKPVTIFIKDAPDSDKGDSFTFTVNNQLMVISTFPADKSTQVKVFNNIEFELNTDQINLQDIQNAFSISPDVGGDFRQQGYRYVFSPLAGLDYGATYTVTLDAEKLRQSTGLQIDENISFSFTVLGEEEAENEHLIYPSYPGALNTQPNQKPMALFYASSKLADTEPVVKVDLFEMDFDRYQKELKTIAENNHYDSYYDSYYTLSVDGLKNTLSFDAKLIETDTSYLPYSRDNYGILFPEALPSGWYAARFTIPYQEKDITHYLLIQSSDLAIFTMNLGEKDTDMLTWVNDLTTGEPVENAKIKLLGDVFGEGFTAADGLSKVPLKSSYTNNEDDFSAHEMILTISDGDRNYSDILRISLDGNSSDSKDYITYLYTDREIYRTSDTIKVWGVARPRYADSPAVGELTLDFENGTVQQKVTPNKDGTFMAEISYQNLTSSYWANLRLMKEDTVLTRKGIEIQDYVKPIYTASVVPDKPVYMVANDPKMTFGIDISTFDGTPASDFQMQMSTPGGTAQALADPASLAADKNGHINSYIIASEEVDTWRPTHYSATLSNTQAENESFFINVNLYGIHRNVMLTGSLNMGKDSAAVTVNTNKLTLANVKTTDDLLDYKNLKGEAISRPIEAAVHKRYFEKVEDGTYYDYILRETVTKYKYEERDEIVDTYKFETTGGQYVLNNLPVSKPNDGICYYLTLSCEDTKGNIVEETVYLGRYLYGYNNNMFAQYGFKKVSEHSEADYSTINQTYHDYYYFNEDSATFKENEDVTFALTFGEEELSKLDGKLLYVTAQDSFHDVNITTDPSFTLKYDEKMMPNYAVAGVYFDGEKYFTVQQMNVQFDKASRKMDIQLTSDKEAYQPAEQVTVTALATNAETGKPIPNTTLLLSVVDEAVFAIQEQYVDLLGSIHSSIYSPHIQMYVSSEKSNPDTAGGKGGGGEGEDSRYKFLDTAEFVSATTDASGKAVFQFKLPDNITEWRLTSLGLQGNYAGNTKTGIKATQPFFVLPVLNDTILTGDTFSIGLRSAGTGIESSDAVDYRVTLEGAGGYKKTLVKTSPAGEYVSVDTDGLKSGDYTVTVSGTAKGLSDSVRLPFSVVDSGIEISLTKTFDLKEPISVNALRYPVNLSIYNKDAQLYYQVISFLQAQNYGSRTDFRIANQYLDTLYQEQGNPQDNTNSKNLSLTAVYDTFFRLFPQDSLNYELTAKAFLAAPDVISPVQDTDYRKMAKDYGNLTGRDTALYLIEAIQKQNNQKEILAKLKTADEKGLDFADKMYLTTALAVCGDTKTAEKYYAQWVTPVLKEMTGVSGDKALYVNIKDFDDTFIGNTAAASMAASVLGNKDAEGLVRYLISAPFTKEAYPLELVVFLEHYSSDTSGKAEFSYVKDGKTVKETLNGSNAVYLTMTKEQLASADFKVLSGNVNADVFYWGTPSSRLESKNQLIGLTKTIEPVDGGFRNGNMVKITITPDLSKLNIAMKNNALIINDYIPSGMRYVGTDNPDAGYGWYLDNRQGQRVTFTIYNPDMEGGMAPIVYYARCTNSGDYIKESAYINSVLGDVWGASSRDIIHINQ